ncbi:MAG: purine-nucleoside phosphorylase [Polyangiaceae bacterium]|jgi:purine-nucleoside phosphorylase|nr:purine-nucleoside phosphorylase [Polyangiaceae bacterium]
MVTPHIAANPGDFADVVLMPGDPLRAKYIAEKFLEAPRQINAVRGMLGFTGSFRGKKVSVMGHGMGIPSISIYATELIKEFGVKVVMRVGSCGAVRHDVKLREVIVAIGAGTDSKVNRLRFLDHDFPAVADFQLTRRAIDTAAAQGKRVHAGNVFSADLFYSPQTQMLDILDRMGILAIEMEAAGLYGVAAEYGARALTLLTVSDHLRTGEHLSPEDRQTSFNEMIEIALDVAAQESAG